MKTKCLFIALITALAVSVVVEARSQRRLQVITQSVPESKHIADCAMEFVYDYSYSVDTVVNESQSRISDQMLLQVGYGISKFSSYRNIRIDSLIAVSSKEEIIANYEKFVGGETMNVFKNYPAGMMTSTGKICMDWFMYEEDAPQFDWHLTDSVKMILGYECKAARCSFRGREWTAWYTDEIPVMDGPWKFGGLPGLIMEARDAKDEYVFECIGINSKPSRDIRIYDVQYNNTDRKKYYDTLHRYDTNPYSYAQTTSGVNVTVTDEAGNPDPGAFDPVEPAYDYIERDWRKK